MPNDPPKDIPLELLMVLANSDVVLDTQGYCGIQFTYGAGCLFIGPEKPHTLDWSIDPRHQLSRYPIRDVRAESTPHDLVMIGLMGLTTTETFAIYRTADSLPNFPGYRTIPWEMYQGMRSKNRSL
ncbi:hypothetical protein HOD38_00675 [archaeon]|jgi:hypothetical protein|nr:hypothetical protein [archaeon]MBT4396759.1 hypothetical protein [archaeon]MBT4441369.1 hypothetical protein [archaeon]